MEVIGLIPSDTGEPGGKRTGQRVTHYILDGGPFWQVCTALLAQGFTISWRDRPKEDGPTPPKGGKRDKFCCPGCSENAWARPDALLVCGQCMLPMSNAIPSVTTP